MLSNIIKNLKQYGKETEKEIVKNYVRTDDVCKDVKENHVKWRCRMRVADSKLGKGEKSY